MELHQIRDRNKLAAYFQQDLPLHTYSLGDLDDLTWPWTTYYAEEKGKELSRVTLLYQGEDPPVLLVLGPETHFRKDYYRSLFPLLPRQFYTHLSPNLEQLFEHDFEITDHGKHYKMNLVDRSALGEAVPGICQRLQACHLAALENLYQQSYPANTFNPRMLVTERYYGCWFEGVLVSVAGVHVHSTRYRVAALGNITTHPGYRKQGFARIVTSHLCRVLLEETDTISLNVKIDNTAAISLYRSLGFQFSAKYGEFYLKRRF